MKRETALFEYLVRLGDDSLILSQRLSQWSGEAPTLEVDLSISNIALDHIGQATLLLEYAGKVEGQGRDADKLAFHRDTFKFRNCLLVEQPNGDFAQTVARLFLFSTWQCLLYRNLCKSSDEHLAAIAAKSLKEIRYHADWASEWVVRLGDGTDESHERLIKGFDWMWRFLDELFAADKIDSTLIELDIAVAKDTLRAEFDVALQQTFKAATLPVVELPTPIYGGRTGHHSEHLGHILAEMQFLPRAYPGATW